MNEVLKYLDTYTFKKCMKVASLYNAVAPDYYVKMMYGEPENNKYTFFDYDLTKRCYNVTMGDVIRNGDLKAFVHLYDGEDIGNLLHLDRTGKIVKYMYINHPQVFEYDKLYNNCLQVWNFQMIKFLYFIGYEGNFNEMSLRWSGAVPIAKWYYTIKQKFRTQHLDVYVAGDIDIYNINKYINSKSVV